MKNKWIAVLLGGVFAISAFAHQDDSSNSGELKSAMSGVEMVIPATSTSESAKKQYAIGWAKFEVGRFNQAHNYFVKSIAADPKFAIGYLMSALTAQSTSSFDSYLDKALASQNKASKAEQHLIQAFKSGLASDNKAQIEHGEALTKLMPQSSRAWVFLGNFYSGVNRTDDARRAYSKAISLQPSLVWAHTQLGNNYMFLNPQDIAKAEQAIKQAIALVPNEPNPHDLLGDVHRKQGNLPAAYQDYTTASKLAPDLGSPLQQRGHVNSFMGKYSKARADYTRAAELEDARGSNAGPFFLMFRAYVSLHEGDFDRAIRELEELEHEVAKSSMEGKNDLAIGSLSQIGLIAIHANKPKIAKNAIDKAAKVMRIQAQDVGTDTFTNAQEANIDYLYGLHAAKFGNAAALKLHAKSFKQHIMSSTNSRKHERLHEIYGMNAYYQGNMDVALEHLAKGDNVNNAYNKYYLALAHQQAGHKKVAKNKFMALSKWNFNGPGYAMIRNDVLKEVNVL